LHEKKASPMSMIGFPLLLIPLTIYNIIVFLMPGVSFADPVLKVPLMSGAEWPVTLSDMLLALAILLLLSEVIKGARPGAKYLTDHLLSLIVFGAAAAEFLLWPRFGSSTYFLLTLLALVDFLSGLALRTRRKMAVAVAPAAASRRNTETPEPAPPEPRFDPASEPSVPAAASVAESVLQERSQPQMPHPDATSVTPPAKSPEVTSPAPSPEVTPAAPSPEAASPPPSPEVKSSAPSPEVASPELEPGHGSPPPAEEPRR